MVLAVWHRPWAWLDRVGNTWQLIQAGTSATQVEQGGVWLRTDTPDALLIDNRRVPPCRAFSFAQAGQIVLLPLPQRRRTVTTIDAGTIRVDLDFAGLPERPPEGLEPANDEQKRAMALLDRVKSVWARMRDVEMALGDPATLWARLTHLWLADSAKATPEMDVIVRHANALGPALERLDRAPRRNLRRTRSMVALSRVQEMDRQAMTWLIRQPGETIEQRAGNRQRIQAVVREENFNTLENRVLLSYTILAQKVAREYRARHPKGHASSRLRRVQGFGLRCREMAAELHARGVLEGNADVNPNFALQNNADYHAVWLAWRELLQRGRILDDLWRWQARSWEEFCALAVIVALQSVSGARPLAVSPIVFRDEQIQGCWIEYVNPLAVFYLPDLQVIVEVTYRADLGNRLGQFGAPIWLRAGRIGSRQFPSRWAVWPLWHAMGGLHPGEAHQLAELLPAGKQDNVSGGITLRPVAAGASAEQDCHLAAACFTLGASEDALREGIVKLAEFLRDFVLGRVT